METEQQRIVDRADERADEALEDRVTDLEALERHRDAGDGRFVTAEDAAARPGETIAESTEHPTRREVAAARALLVAALEREERESAHGYRTQADERVGTLNRIDDLTAAIGAVLLLLE